MRRVPIAADMHVRRFAAGVYAVLKWTLVCALWFIVWYAALTPVSLVYNEVSGAAHAGVAIVGNAILFGWPLLGLVLAIRRSVRSIRNRRHA
jgi:hypothetical protein